MQQQQSFRQLQPWTEGWLEAHLMSPNAYAARLVELLLGQRFSSLSLLYVSLDATQVYICF